MNSSLSVKEASASFGHSFNKRECGRKRGPSSRSARFARSFFECNDSNSPEREGEEEEDDDDNTTNRRYFLLTSSMSILTIIDSMSDNEYHEAKAYGDEKTVPAHQTEQMDEVVYRDYVDIERGFTMKVPIDWQMDTPNGVLEREFHPVAEYGGRRCTIIVNPVGKVEPSSPIDNNNNNDDNNDSDSTQIRKVYLKDLGVGYGSAEELGKTKANDFAPLNGPTGGAKAATFLDKFEESDDGQYYFYEWSSQAMLNFRFWEVAVLGPGLRGSGRKLGRKDVISVKCQMPEDGMTKGDEEIFNTITRSLKLLPEKDEVFDATNSF